MSVFSLNVEIKIEVFLISSNVVNLDRMISHGVQLTDVVLFLYLTISLKIPIIIISHIIHGNTPESSPLPLQNRHTPHNKHQNEMQALYLMIASKNSCSEFHNYGLPLHITADVKD